MPSITVLMSAYNSERYIAEAIESVVNQDVGDFEFIIVDDGSDDSTADIINHYAKHDGRIVFIQKEHSGLSSSLNEGLKNAQGEWVARLDADDVSFPYRLRKQLEFVRQNPDVMLLGGGCVEIDEEGSPVKIHTYPRGHKNLLRRLEHCDVFFPHSSAFFNREFVAGIGGYNNRFRRSQDYDLWLRIAERAKIGCLGVPVVRLRRHGRMISHSSDGSLQAVMGISAVVCHLQRKWGLSDPSAFDEGGWQDFISWVRRRLEDERILEQRKQWQIFRDEWYSSTCGTFSKILRIAQQFLCRQSFRQMFWRHVRRKSFARALSRERIKGALAR